MHQLLIGFILVLKAAVYFVQVFLYQRVLRNNWSADRTKKNYREKEPFHLQHLKTSKDRVVKNNIQLRLREIYMARF